MDFFWLLFLVTSQSTEPKFLNFFPHILILFWCNIVQLNMQKITFLLHFSLCTKNDNFGEVFVKHGDGTFMDKTIIIWLNQSTCIQIIEIIF